MKLRLEELSVESFAVLPEAHREAGTIHGYAETGEESEATGPSCPEGTCYGPSCVDTCGRTCPNTCKWSCDDPTCWWSCDTGPCNCATVDTGPVEV